MNMKLKQLKKGDFFTLKPMNGKEAEAKDIFLKLDYDRSLKKYECQAFSDICYWKYLKPETEVYTDFTF